MSSAAAAPKVPRKRKRRNYQACEPCRVRKAKCERGSEDDPLPPPCGRCKRESIQSQCIINPKRTRKYSEKEFESWAPENDRDSIAGRMVSHEVNERQEFNGQSTSDSVASLEGVASHNSISLPSNPLNRGELRRNSHQYGVSHPVIPNSQPWVSNSQRNLTDNVIQTLVTKPNDALSLLFEAAERQEPSALNTRDASPELGTGATLHQSLQSGGVLGVSQHGERSSMPTPISSIKSPAVALPCATAETISIWESYIFVRQGWLTAREAISYIDLFFHNMSTFSPVFLDSYADHANHRELMANEKMLCITILTISSRYHVLPGGVLRGDNIHRKFWLQWKKLLMKIMYAEETASNARTRTVGTIESFLLMTEWHPRALHFPPDIDEWNIDLQDEEGENRTDLNQRDQRRSSEMLEAVARRSDRMSWMLLGSALTLAHELGISDQRLQDRGLATQHFDNQEKRQAAESIELRLSRPRRLLYIYINQLASRLGWSSMLPRIISDSGDQTLGGEADQQWHNAMSRWISLTRLLKTANDMLFSPVTAKHLLDSGNYVTSLEHFAHLLQDWHKEYCALRVEKRYLDILFIEFQFTRAYINSLALQAVVERVFKLTNPQSGPTDFLMTAVYESHSVDWTFIQSVVDGSRKLLRKVIEMNAENGLLKYCPVRIFSRIISASILLLKATGVGARIEEAQVSLELLDSLISALRFDPVDELHLANQYASLLETHVKAFRRRYLRVGRVTKDALNREQPPEVSLLSMPNNEQNSWQNGSQTVPAQDLNAIMGGDINDFNPSTLGDYGDMGMMLDDWMCLPLDAFDPAAEIAGNWGATGLDFFFLG